MRIPSQFNQDSLYRRDNRQRETGSSNRRLIRLVIGLALVIVVMRQASRPAMYQTFFESSPATATMANQTRDPSRPPRGESGVVGERQPAATGPTSSTDKVSIDDRAIAHAIVANLLPTDQRQWMVALTRWRSGRSLPSVPSSIESITSQLTTMDSVQQEKRAEWLDMLRSFSNAASLQPGDSLATATPSSDLAGQSSLTTSGSNQLPSDNDLPRVIALITALDDAANSRVVDGSVWRSGDFDSLYRFLDQANQSRAEDASATGVLPLLQQPEVFRNQWVQIHGGVARVERVEAQENPFGIPAYWQLWLRPSDGADRPMVAIVPEVPESVALVGSKGTKTEGPEIVVVGRFLKRLAYQSGMGADLAPVVVGRIASAPASQRELNGMTDTTVSENAISLWLPALLACLLGVASAVLVMWRTSVSAKRARALRGSHRAGSDSFLNALEHSEHHPHAPHQDQ